MGVFLNPKNSAFKGAVEDEIYVDKSGLIGYTNQLLCTNQKYICNSRPRRFGKSMAANMLVAYYSKGADSEELFSKLEISKDPNFKEHLNKYDVILLDIQWISCVAGSPDKTIPFIRKKVIGELKEYYPGILKVDVVSLTDALSIINEKTKKRFVIIIDEWDVFIRDYSNNKKLLEDYALFLRGLFKGLFPDRYIALAYITGILPVNCKIAEIGMNNFDQYTMLFFGSFSKYVGFTEDEVKSLCERYNADFEKIKLYYDGYRLGKYHVYNPIDIVNSLNDGELFRSYWCGTASYEAIVPYMDMKCDGLKESIIALLAGNEVQVNVNSYKNDIVGIDSKDKALTYLIHLGYLGYNNKKETAYITNEEIREQMVHAAKETHYANEITKLLEDFDIVIRKIMDINSGAVDAYISKAFDKYISREKYIREEFLASILATAFLGSIEYYYKPHLDVVRSKGFADFVYIPKPRYVRDYPALVIELKWNKDAATAIDQIKARNYPESIKGYTDNILLVGISYDKNTKKHECVIEKLDTTV